MDASSLRLAVADTRWSEWEAALRSGGINAGRWMVVKDGNEEVTGMVRVNLFSLGTRHFGNTLRRKIKHLIYTLVYKERWVVDCHLRVVL